MDELNTIWITYNSLFISDFSYKLRYFLEFVDPAFLKNCISMKFNLDYKLALKDFNDLKIVNADLQEARKEFPIDIIYNLMSARVFELLNCNIDEFLFFLSFLLKALTINGKKSFFTMELWKMFVLLFKLSINQKELNKLGPNHIEFEERYKKISLIIRRIIFLILLNPDMPTKADKYGVFLTIFYTLENPDEKTRILLHNFFIWWQSTPEFKKWSKHR